MQGQDLPSDHIPQLPLLRDALRTGAVDLAHQHYAAVDQSLGMLNGTYREELIYLAADDSRNEIAEEIGETLSGIYPLLSRLGEFVESGNFRYSFPTLVELESSVETLFALFAQYRQLGEQIPKLSQLPYTHELLRVGHQFLEGKLGIDAVFGRLEVFYEFHEALESQLSTLVPSPPERDAFEERLEDLKEAISLQHQGLEELEQALELNDSEQLSESLDAIAEAGEVLVEVYQALQQADLQPKTISCVHCGATNSLDSKLCGSCGAVLPQSAGSSSVGSTLVLHEDGSSAAHQDPEEIAKLQEGVNHFLGTGDHEAFSQTLEVYRQKVRNSQKQFSSLKTPPADIPPDHLELLHRAQILFSQTLEDSEVGLMKLEEGARCTDPILLEEGMDSLRAASASYLEFSQCYQRAEELIS